MPPFCFHIAGDGTSMRDTDKNSLILIWRKGKPLKPERPCARCASHQGRGALLRRARCATQRRRSDVPRSERGKHGTDLSCSSSSKRLARDTEALLALSHSTVELLFRRIEARASLSPAERQLLADVFDPHLITTGARRDLVREGDRPTESTLLLRGFATRYRVLDNGRRQITALHVPGDFIDLQSFPLRLMDHSVGALTECVTATAPHAALLKILETSSRLTLALWTLTILDSAVHREWIVAMGAMQSVEHAAHLICEVYLRLKVVGLCEHKRFPFPVTQSDLADTLGISAVHVNRVLQELRKAGLIRFENGVLEILDWAGLAKMGRFDDKHLHLGEENDAMAKRMPA
jgi:CRP-like cAMP-binding protein